MDCDVVGPSAGLLLQAGQDRRVADQHAEPSHQPLRGPPARAMAKQPNNFRQSGGPARELKWPRAAGPFLAAVKLEDRLLVVLYQAAKGSVCC